MKLSPYQILIRPVITEDSTVLAALTEPQYVFRVATAANKIEIARAVETAFGVKVIRVNNDPPGRQGAPHAPHRRTSPGLQEGVRDARSRPDN